MSKEGDGKNIDHVPQYLLTPGRQGVVQMYSRSEGAMWLHWWR